MFYLKAMDLSTFEGLSMETSEEALDAGEIDGMDGSTTD